LWGRIKNHQNVERKTSKMRWIIDWLMVKYKRLMKDKAQPGWGFQRGIKILMIKIKQYN
jgi:hypothetical protein